RAGEGVRATVFEVAEDVEGADLDVEGATGGLVAERVAGGVGDAEVVERRRVDGEAGRYAARGGAVDATVVDDLDQGAGAGLGQGERVRGEDAVREGGALGAAGRALLAPLAVYRAGEGVRATVFEVAED